MGDKVPIPPVDNIRAVMILPEDKTVVLC